MGFNNVSKTTLTAYDDSCELLAQIFQLVPRTLIPGHEILDALVDADQLCHSDDLAGACFVLQAQISKSLTILSELIKTCLTDLKARSGELPEAELQELIEVEWQSVCIKEYIRTGEYFSAFRLFETANLKTIYLERSLKATAQQKQYAVHKRRNLEIARLKVRELNKHSRSRCRH